MNCKDFLDASDYMGAINCFRQKLKTSPNDVDLINGLGISFSLSGQHQQAIFMFNRVLALDPELVPGHYNKACSLLQHGQDRNDPECFAEALHHLNYIESHCTSNPDYFCHRAGIKKMLFDNYGGEHWILAAISDFEVALELDKEELAYYIDLAEAITLLGKLRHQMDDLISALTVYTEALGLFPDEPEILTNKGALHFEIGQASGEVEHIVLAIECFEQALFLSPETIFLYHNIGNSNWNAYNLSKEIKYAEQTVYWLGKFLTLDQDDAKSYQLYGLALSEMGQATLEKTYLIEAVSAFDEVLQRQPGYENAINAKGLAYKKIAEIEDNKSWLLASIEVYESAIISNNNNSTFYYHKGLSEMVIFLDYKDNIYIYKAIESYKQAIELDEDNKQYPPALAYAFLELSRFHDNYLEQALMWYKHAFQLDKENPHIYIGLGKTFYYMGKIGLDEFNLERSLSFFKRVIAQSKDNNIGYYELAKAYECLTLEFNNREYLQEAIANYNIAISLDPTNNVKKNRTGIFLRKAGKEYKIRKLLEQSISIFEALGELEDHRDLFNNNKGLALANIGEIFLERDKVLSAISHYNEALKLVPDSYLIIYNLAQAYAILGKNWGGLDNLEKSIELYQQSIDIKNDFAVSHYYKGLAFEFICQQYHQCKESEALESFLRAFYLNTRVIGSVYKFLSFITENFNAPHLVNRILVTYPQLLFISTKSQVIQECLNSYNNDQNRLSRIMEELRCVCQVEEVKTRTKFYGAITAFLGGDPISAFDHLSSISDKGHSFASFYFHCLSAREILHPEADSIMFLGLQEARKRVKQGKLTASEVYYISSLFMLNGEFPLAIKGFELLEGQQKFFAANFKHLECLLRLDEQGKAKAIVEMLHLNGWIDSFSKAGFSDSATDELEFLIQKYESLQGWYLAGRLMDEQDVKLQTENIPRSRSIFNWSSSVKKQWPESSRLQLNALNSEYLDALERNLRERMVDIFTLYERKRPLPGEWISENMYSHMFNEHKENGCVIFEDYINLLVYCYAKGKLTVNEYLLISSFLKLKNILLNRNPLKTSLKIASGPFLTQILQPFIEGLGTALTAIPVKPLIKLIFDNRDEETIKMMNFQIFENHFNELQKLSKSEISNAIELIDNDFLEIATDYLDDLK